MTAQPKAVPPIPEGTSTVMPWLISRDTARLLEFLKQAFGAQELTRLYNEDGTIAHAEARIGNSIVGGSDAREGWPDAPCFLRLYVEDADAVYQQALSAGAVTVTETTSLSWGTRMVTCARPTGQYLVDARAASGRSIKRRSQSPPQSSRISMPGALLGSRLIAR